MSFSAASMSASGEAAARQQMEPGSPFATFVVPSIGSRARSNLWLPGIQVPRRSPLNIPGALSLTPSPITTSPRMFIKSNIPRIASQAAASAFSFSPRPIHSSVFKAALSVALRKSNSIIRSKSSYGGCRVRIVGLYGGYQCIDVKWHTKVSEIAKARKTLIFSYYGIVENHAHRVCRRLELPLLLIRGLDLL